MCWGGRRGVYVVNLFLESALTLKSRIKSICENSLQTDAILTRISVRRNGIERPRNDLETSWFDFKRKCVWANIDKANWLFPHGGDYPKLRRFERQKYESSISKIFVSLLSLWTPIYNDFCPLPRQGESTPAIRGHFQQYPDEETHSGPPLSSNRRPPRFWPFAFLDRARSGGNLLNKRFMNPSAMAARYLFHHRVRTRGAQKNAKAVCTREQASKREKR